MCKYTNVHFTLKNNIMNGAYTPGLMKKMSHPIQKKYCNNPTKQMGKSTHAIGHNRTDNVLLQSGEQQQEGVFQEAFRAPVTTKQYPTITSADSSRIRGAYEYLKSTDQQRQQILDDGRSSATVEEADSYSVNQLINLSKTYGLDAVKGVGNNKK